VLCTETRKWREHGTETGQGWEQAGEAGHGRSGRRATGGRRWMQQPAISFTVLVGRLEPWRPHGYGQRQRRRHQREGEEQRDHDIGRRHLLRLRWKNWIGGLPTRMMVMALYLVDLCGGRRGLALNLYCWLRRDKRFNRPGLVCFYFLLLLLLSLCSME
jgi:hypothetical protein